MDSSVRCAGSLPSPPRPELQNEHKDVADRARQRLLAISQTDASSNLQDMAKPVVGKKGVEKECEPHSPPLHPGEEQTDQDEVYRNKLISISYDEGSLPTFDIPQSNGGHVASPSPGKGHGSPPA